MVSLQPLMRNKQSVWFSKLNQITNTDFTSARKQVLLCMCSSLIQICIFINFAESALDYTLFVLFLTAITFPEYKSYQDQVNQLMDGKMKLEFHLLKLKQDREILKDQGAVHEDTIMKDNANMQVSFKITIHD